MDNTFLNDVERAQISSFLGNETMREAIKKVMLFYVYHSESLQEGKAVPSDKHWVYGACQNPSESDEIVGRKIRVKVDALALIEESFKDLEKFKLVEQKEVEEIKNKAR